jgi:hypothetical protein
VLDAGGLLRAWHAAWATGRRVYVMTIPPGWQSFVSCGDIQLVRPEVGRAAPAYTSNGEHDVQLGKTNVRLQTLAIAGFISRFWPQHEVYRWLTGR